MLHAPRNIKQLLKLPAKPVRFILRSIVSRHILTPWEIAIVSIDSQYIKWQRVLKKKEESVDTTNESVCQLSTLGIPVQHWNQILVFMLVQRLDWSTSES